MTRAVRAALAAACLIALAAGCAARGPAVTEVEGVVTGPDGKPMPDILVQFNPDMSTDRKVMASSAVTDASGRFVLKCDDGTAGALVGPHRIVLIDNAIGSEEEPDPKKPNRAPPKRNRIPRSYLSPTSTPLLVTVEAGKKSYDLKVGR